MKVSCVHNTPPVKEEWIFNAQNLNIKMIKYICSVKDPDSKKYKIIKSWNINCITPKEGEAIPLGDVPIPSNIERDVRRKVSALFDVELHPKEEPLRPPSDFLSYPKGLFNPCVIDPPGFDEDKFDDFPDINDYDKMLDDLTKPGSIKMADGEELHLDPKMADAMKKNMRAGMDVFKTIFGAKDEDVRK